MTLEDAQDAAAQAIHNIDCGCHTYAETPNQDEALHYLSLAQAAAEILIPAGRHQAAKDIAAYNLEPAARDNAYLAQIQLIAIARTGTRS